jgi:aspartate carbamoyltransferase catalytic subunit
MKLKSKNLLGLEEVTSKEISLILATAKSMKEIFPQEKKGPPPLKGKLIINLFYEPSTRTRTSFEIAGKRLGADIINFDLSTSSVSKGETLKDTALNLHAMKPDIIVIRHPVSGAPQFIADNISASVINAGDGAHEHPTQALLDLFTIKETFGKIERLRVAIIGDISHSRVARSNIWGLTKLGAHVKVAGPPALIPSHIEKMGIEVFYDVDAAIKDVDVIMCLRIQKERQNQNLFTSLKEYSLFFGINQKRLAKAKPGAMVMHPGPINREVEITSEVADGKKSLILKQVANGIAVRMALFYLLAGGKQKNVAH